MFLADFHAGNAQHISTLTVIAAAAAGVILAARRFTAEQHRRALKLFVGWGCIAFWILNTAYWMSPAHFDLGSSLPIHFCNVANIFGALAILRGMRLFQGVIYFWSGLYIWAFITPTVGYGPESWGYWVFWIYHSFILFALAYLVFIDRFRPTFRDLLQSSLFTLGYVFFLAIIDAIAGWNYGFLGNDVPGAATPVALLGPYPLRILWMILIGAVIFLLLWLPFRRYSPTRTRK